jgi:hypothetical protein
VYGIDRSLCVLLTSLQRSKRRSWFARPVDTSAPGTIAIPSTITRRSCRQITSDGIKIAFIQPKNTYGIVSEHEPMSIVAKYMTCLEESSSKLKLRTRIISFSEFDSRWSVIKRDNCYHNFCIEKMISDMVLKLALNEGLTKALKKMVSDPDWYNYS